MQARYTPGETRTNIFLTSWNQLSVALCYWWTCTSHSPMPHAAISPVQHATIMSTASPATRMTPGMKSYTSF